MIGIDTNILVRYLTQGDKEQAQIVEQILNKYATYPNSVFINNVVMCELIWVLERGYKYSRDDIARAIKQILATEEFNFEDQEELWIALTHYSQTKLDFSDAIIGEINNKYGCTETFTFDQTAVKSTSFKLASIQNQ